MKTTYVRVEYLDENKEWHCEEIPIEKWAEITAKKPISSLYELEKVLTDIRGKETILSKDFPQIRKSILNFAGEVSRLPGNLIIKDEENPFDKGGFFDGKIIEFGKMENKE